MATAAVDSASPSAPNRQDDRFHSDFLPLIDLRLLSQSELLSLSLCSSTSPVNHLQNDTDVSTPKIDRSVFNESAGSRKQTFSRLRLAPRNHNKNNRIENRINSPQFSPFETPLQSDRENSQIISLLKSLFGSSSQPEEDHNHTQNDNNLVSVPVSYQEDVLCLPLPSVTDGKPSDIGVGFCDSSSKKRKRGRPRKHGDNEVSEVESQSVVEEGEEAVMEVENVPPEELAGLEDPVEEELRRRTEGMQTKAELLGFLEGLEGEWGSSRKKRRIVDANVFGKGLPSGWKVMLCVKKRANYFWLICGKYIRPDFVVIDRILDFNAGIFSPNGQQFVSCKEVSSYLLSSCGLQDENQLNFSDVNGSIQLADQKSSRNAADHDLNNGKNGKDVTSNLSSPVASKSPEHRKQAIPSVVGNLVEVQTEKEYKCHKCSAAFDEQDDLLQHLLSSHHRAPKRLRCEASLREEVIIKNGKYECQFCRKLFEERRRFHGHLGNHIKDYFKRIEATGRAASAQKSPKSGSVGVPTHMLETPNSVTDWHSPTAAPKADWNDPYSGMQDNSSVETTCDKQDTVSSVRDDEAQKMSDIVATDVDVCLVAESALSNKESNTIHKSSNKAYTLKHSVNGTDDLCRQEQSYQNCSEPAVERDAVGITHKNADWIPTGLVEGNKQDKGFSGHLPAPNVESKVFTDVNIDARLHCRTVDEMETDCRDLARKGEQISGGSISCAVNVDIEININKQRNSEVYSVVPSSSLDGTSELLTSVMVEASEEKGSREDFVVDEKICVEDPINRRPRAESPSNESKFDEVCEPEPKPNNVTIGCQCNNTVLGHDNNTSNRQVTTHGNCSVIQPLQEQVHLEVKESECSKLNFSGDEQLVGLKNNGSIGISNGAVKMFRHVEVLLSNKQEFRDGDVVGLDGVSMTNIRPERSSNSSLLAPSAIGHEFGSKGYGVCDRIPEELEQERNPDCRTSSDCLTENDQKVWSRVSVITKEAQHEEAKGSCSDQICVAFGFGQTQQDADVVTSTLQDCCSKDCVLSGDRQIFSTGNESTGVDDVSMDELKHKRDSIEGSLLLSSSEQLQADNLHTVPSGTAQEPSLEDSENKDVLSFSSHIQQNENALSELVWRTDEENDLLSSFPDTASRLQQKSGCFPDKAESDLFGGKLDGLSDFEGLRSSSVENLEYDFLTSHVNSQPHGSKAFPYDAEVSPGFDSSVWLEKEALPLLPKIAKRHRVPTVCVWCRNEFNHEIPESGVQTGLLGFTCESCNAKFSAPFNIL
ncbi:hypothetical protein Tsubulata_022963 [Turnera subulata]|uniref:C2H2-type domain-containing protein n=1 Tax=Turnera subulata TaxID=218843 RepID=A0A9Q0JE97_9ROSI|nr:hypothetical protein Tsubulata_022963 [Turnera subulata]